MASALHEMNGGKKKKFISSAVKHPGALTSAAKRHGRSKMEEAEVESHSKDPHIRGRGLLGLRFMRGEFRKKKG